MLVCVSSNRTSHLRPSCGDRCPAGHHLSEEKICDLCTMAKETLGKESNVARATAPVTIVGDIHGQLHDFIELMKIGGQ